MNIRRDLSGGTAPVFRFFLVTASAAGVLLPLCGCPAAPPQEVAHKAELVLDGLTNPLFVTYAPGHPDWIFVVEQGTGTSARIVAYSQQTQARETFLTVLNLSTGGERGLLGLAFHPDFQSNNLFYINYTDANGNTMIERYAAASMDPPAADPATAQTVLTIEQPASNHNGGWLAFGPDGFLYVAVGDGGSANDPNNNAQNIETLLGTLLRLDVNGDHFPDDAARNYAIPADNPFINAAGLDEIWAYGLRNPWRCAFDRQTGALFIADVGQQEREEVNRQRADSPGGENYGWRCLEGTYCTNFGGCACDDPSLVAPLYEYSHGGLPFRCSITGGYVYRGSAIPELVGQYFFADFCSGQIWSFDAGAAAPDARNRTAELRPVGRTISSISSFGEDAAGELYICDLTGGAVYRIVPRE